MAVNFPLHYEATLEWSGAKRGRLSSAGVNGLEVSIPPEFGGPKGYWSPEHLFVASVASCIMATFLAIAENSQLEIAGYASSAKGTLDKVAGEGLRFTKVVIKARVTVREEKDREIAARVLAKAEETCLVSHSIKPKVIVEPEIVVESAAPKYRA